MARSRKRVSGKTTNTILWVVGGAAVAFALYELLKPQVPAATIIRTTTPVNTSSATTAAEVAAGAGVLTSIANDLFGDSDS